MRKINQQFERPLYWKCQYTEGKNWGGIRRLKDLLCLSVKSKCHENGDLSKTIYIFSSIPIKSLLVFFKNIWKTVFTNLYRIMKDHGYSQEPWTKRNIAKVSPQLIAYYSMGTIVIKQQNASSKVYT